MSEPSARTSKFSKFLAKLGCTKSKGSAETIPLNDYECSNTQNFDYLNYRREWTERYTSEDQSNHGGALSDKKSDLEMCGLLHLQADLSDELKKVSCDTSSEISCSDSCCYGFEEEGNQNSANIEQGKMESDQSRNKKNVFKLFNMGSLKKHKSNDSSIYSLEGQGSAKEKSGQITPVKISYASVPQPGPSQESYYTSPKTAASVDVPPDESLLAKQHSILRRLHSTLHEATNIVGEFLQLYKRD